MTETTPTKKLNGLPPGPVHFTHPGASLEQLHAKLRGKLTLVEAREVETWARKLRGA